MSRFKYIQQNDEKDCGPACLAAIFRKYGLKLSIAKIREIAGTDREGTSAYGLIKTAEHYGFQSKAAEAHTDALNSAMPLPAIAHVIVDQSLQHYVVITKITADKVIVSDPAKGIISYKKSDFLKIWTNILIFVVPSENAQKGNKKESTLISFFKLLASQKLLLGKIFILSLLVTSLGVAASFYYQVLMDHILPLASFEMLNLVSVFTLGLFLVQIGLSFLRGVLTIKLERNIDLPIMLGYYNHAVDLPMGFYSMRDTGEIISRFNDATSIRDIVSEATLTIMLDTLMAVVGAVVLFNCNRMLFFISVVILLLYAVIVFVYNKPIRKINRETMELNSRVTSQFVETINGIETIKSFNQQEVQKQKTGTMYHKLLKKVLNGGILFLSQQTVTTFVAVIGGLVILWFGASLVINGTLTLGELITFNALLAYFIDPIKNLINLQPNIQSAVVAADRLGEILEVATEPGGNKLPDGASGKLDFQTLAVSNLNFRYSPRSLVLNGIDMEISRGEKIAFVGESGSGKTTLAKLLIRFYEQESGTIKLNGVDIASYPIKLIRNNISYVSQDVFLFSGTIKENLLFGNYTASDEELSRVCKMCELEDFINSLPLSYNTRIEENGKNLSGGQKQRFAIARALLKKPEILIMDEATSHLDSITEKAIENTINGISDQITTILIAHRLSTIKRCDKIYVFDHGSIIEAGSHDRLMQEKGRYYRLWNEQMN